MHDLDKRAHNAARDALRALPSAQFVNLDAVAGVVAGAVLAEVHRAATHRAALAEPKEPHRHAHGERVPKDCRACASELFDEYWRDREAEEAAVTEGGRPAHACTYGDRCPNCRD